MPNPVQLIPGALAAMLADVIETGILTQNDRHGLRAAVMDESLPDDDRRTINRILQLAQRGGIQLAIATARSENRAA